MVANSQLTKAGKSDRDWYVYHHRITLTHIHTKLHI